MRPKRATLFGLIALAVVTVALVAAAVMRPVGQPQAGDASYTPIAPQKATLVAFLGDSYTAGAGVQPQDAWPSVLASERGWKIVNLARGGTGYLTAYASGGQKACGLDACPNYRGMIPATAAQNPDMVIVSGGRNDGTALTPELDAVVQATFSDLRKALPGARIVALSPVWGADDSKDQAPEFRAAVKAAVESVGGTYVDLGAPLGGRPELIQSDNVHPNTAGQKLLADTVDRLLPQGR